MPYRINLGQACFQTADSPLKLQLTATSHLKSPINCSNQITHTENVQFSHILSAWVTEAPELELRLHFDINPHLEWSLSNLVSSLGEKMCSSKVWSDLGFTIVVKSCETFENINGPRRSCLIFGLCRGTHSSSQTISRRVPSILRNPPGAHPPTNHPVMLLAGIDIYLEYSQPAHPEVNMETMETAGMTHSGYITQILEPDPTSIYYFMAPDILHLSNMNDLDGKDAQVEPESSNLTSDHWQFSNLQILDLLAHPPFEEDDGTIDHLSVLYQLLDKSFRRLVLAAPSRAPQTESTEADSLEKMTNLAPAIFNPLYRQAMEQRAVSIPIISKAITSMMEGSQNPELKRMAGNLLQSTGDYVPNSTASIHSQRRLNHAIQSSLWCIAQKQLRGIKSTTQTTSVFDVSGSRSPIANIDMGFNMLLEPDTYSSDELLDSAIDNDLSQSTYYSGETAIWPDDWMYEDYDDTNDAASYFEYISDSDPTMVDYLFSQDELENSRYQSSTSGMLLSDEDDVPKDEDDVFDLLLDS